MTASDGGHLSRLGHLIAIGYDGFLVRRGHCNRFARHGYRNVPDGRKQFEEQL